MPEASAHAPLSAQPRTDAPAQTDDKRDSIRAQMLGSVNFYHSGRLSAADAKATSLTAIAGIGLGFLVQRTSMQAESMLEAGRQLLSHPSLLVLFGVIVLAVTAQRAVKIQGSDWLSHMVAGAPPDKVADEFLAQSPQELFRNWIANQDILVRIVNRKYRLVNAATWLLLAGFGLALVGA
jgi:hypothetical protein